MNRFSNYETFEFTNEAIGYCAPGPFDCVGPYAKVENCPVDGSDLRITAYATGVADTFFSVPARARYKGRHIGGFFTMDGGGCVFVPHARFRSRLKEHGVQA